MNCVLSAEFAELFELQLIGGLLFVLGGAVVFSLTVGAIETHNYAHT
jgi:hypothetical protein